MPVKRLPEGDEHGCLKCLLIWPDEKSWLDHRPSCFLEGSEPLLRNGRGASKTALGSNPPTAPLKKHRRLGGRLVVGGMCKKGKHAITKDNLYISPQGVATCKDCRKERLRAS